ncbi:unnamed protein product [Staurois parvus]|uniref:Uncharacterized protein n=1 Tax=Staurois parvus TaxID=386267 RepID=A0ABN9G9W4_9NEOB|nr:unnamed protein product [Staurois parvus]
MSVRYKDIEPLQEDPTPNKSPSGNHSAYRGTDHCTGQRCNTTDTENDTWHPGQEKWDCAESIHTEWGQIPRMTPGIQDRRSGTVQSPYIQNGDRYRE